MAGVTELVSSALPSLGNLLGNHWDAPSPKETYALSPEAAVNLGSHPSTCQGVQEDHRLHLRVGIPFLTSFHVTCDPIGNAEEPRRPLPLSKWFPVIPIPKAHAQEFLAHCLVPESIDQRVADGAGEGQPRGPGLQGWGDTVLPPEGLRGDDDHVGAPGDREGAHDHQDADEGFALVSRVDHALQGVPPAARGGGRGAGALPPSPLCVHLLHHHSATVHLACFDPGHSEDEAVAHHHDQEGEQGAPDLPERGVAGLPVPRGHTHPLELVKLH